MTSAASAPDSTRSVLLVEDEAELARLVARELSAAGYRVCHAGDGADAIRLFAAEG